MSDSLRLSGRWELLYNIARLQDESGSVRGRVGELPRLFGACAGWPVSGCGGAGERRARGTLPTGSSATRGGVGCHRGGDGDGGGRCYQRGGRGYGSACNSRARGGAAGAHAPYRHPCAAGAHFGHRGQHTALAGLVGGCGGGARGRRCHLSTRFRARSALGLRQERKARRNGGPLADGKLARQVAINDIGSAEDFMAAIDETIKYFKEGDIVAGTGGARRSRRGSRRHRVQDRRRDPVEGIVDPQQRQSLGRRHRRRSRSRPWSCRWEDDQGRLVLSKKRAQYERAWARIEQES